METIAVSEFRANLQKVLKRVEGGASITIVSRGRVVAQLMPPQKSQDQERQRLQELGKKIDVAFGDFIQLLKTANNYVFRSISPELADLSARLPEEVNSDPADRIITATAIVENSLLVTADQI